uniref:CHCH domain-containing protein n=1 Tax=Globisporangium ultimum (strain ATCC 200006 / CBS 805.95 / DAOM BR144) TaxID=431595 RepID=K3W5T4_GLOUD
MGAEMSKPAAANPCATEMDVYIKCVESRNAESGGLRDGDECEKESEAYRECRKMVKEFQQSQAKAA